MNTFIVAFNTEGVAGSIIEFMDRVVKDDSTNFKMVLSALHLSVFLFKTNWNHDQIIARLEEMNNGSLKFWVAKHLEECVAGQLEDALEWHNQPKQGDSNERA
jgi:hypothetical protein